MPYLVNQR